MPDSIARSPSRRQPSRARVRQNIRVVVKVALVTLPNCVSPSYRADGAPSHVTTLLPKHPMAEGVPVTFEEKWDKGEHFRSGCVWKLGQGKVFYFRPGHETYGVYTQPIPLKIIANAVEWLGGK